MMIYPKAGSLILKLISLTLSFFSAFAFSKADDVNEDVLLEAPSFTSAYSVEEAFNQHRKLPKDDIWWTIYGPSMAWNFKNLHQIFPTVNVYRQGEVRQLLSRRDKRIENFSVTLGDKEKSFSEFIFSESSTAMGVLILHKGDIVFEAYPRMKPHEKPIYWSVAKSFVGVLVRVLEEAGRIDVSRPIDEYITSLRESDLAGISVRDLLDMASGLKCSDSYEARDSCYYRYSMSIGDGYRENDPPDNPYDFAAQLTGVKERKPGEVYSYSGLNTFVLAWLVETVTREPFHDTFSRLIWTKIGAQADASYLAPRYGIPMTHGGFLSNMRDLARFGLLFTPSANAIGADDVISDEHVDFLLHGGRPHLMKATGLPEDALAEIRHNIYQWDYVTKDGTIFKGGWAGQGLMINPSKDVVIVYTGFYKDDEMSEVPLQPIMLGMIKELF